jgi:hypothetical protein
MDDKDRKEIINALEKEKQSKIERILATFDSFKNWMIVTCYLIYKKVQIELNKLFKRLRTVFV